MPIKDLNFWIENNCKLCNKLFWSLKKRNQVFCCNGCSAKFTASDINRLNKIRATKLERYGSETYVNVNKRKKTCLKKYGFDNPSKSDIIINKIKKTNLEKFGVDWTFQSPLVKEKIRSKILDKYNVENISQSDVIRNKIKKTCLEKFGVDNPSKSNIIINKIKKTNLEKFGNVCPLKNKEVAKKSVITNRKRYYLKIQRRLKFRVDMLFDIDTYKNTDKNNKYKFKCKQCDGEFHDHMDGGRIPRCLICYPYINGTSIFEKDIFKFVESVFPNLEIKSKCRDVINPQELDIVIPSLKLAIECNGLYWHSEVGGNKDKKYHLDKYNKCKSEGIRLIHIFEDEWTNSSDIVKNRLRSIFGMGERIFARKCEIREISNEVANQFTDEYHIQGSIPSKYKIGLFYNSELVSVMTFGHIRGIFGKHIKENDTYELLRLASNKNVIGGASKMFTYFRKKYNPTKIISYSDIRWNSGKVYENIGMRGVMDTPVNYWYFKPGYSKRYHRFGFRKSELSKKLLTFYSNLTEWENMQLNGYDRIWDCGNKKYEWKLDQLSSAKDPPPDYGERISLNLK